MLLNNATVVTDTVLTEQTLAAQRPVLFHYALLQLRDSELSDRHSQTQSRRSLAA
jgi:hypothetical protein